MLGGPRYTSDICGHLPFACAVKHCAKRLGSIWDHTFISRSAASWRKFWSYMTHEGHLKRWLALIIWHMYPSMSVRRSGLWSTLLLSTVRMTGPMLPGLLLASFAAWNHGHVLRAHSPPELRVDELSPWLGAGQLSPQTLRLGCGLQGFWELVESHAHSQIELLVMQAS